MMNPLLKKLIIYGSILTFAIFMTTGLLIKMDGMNDKSSDCMFISGENALCDMGLTAHLTHWRQTATTNQDTILLLVLAATESLFVVLKPKINPSSPIKNQKGKNRILEKFDCIREALRAGILHPKIYEKNAA